MNSRERINQWLLDMSSSIGKAFRLDDTGICVITDNEKTDVAIEVPSVDSIFVYLYSSLGPVPEENEPKIFKHLLYWNLYGRETNHATLSLDELTNNVLIHYAEKIEHLDSTLFYNLFHNFFSTVEKVKGKLDDLKRELEKDTSPKPTSVQNWQIKG